MREKKIIIGSRGSKLAMLYAKKAQKEEGQSDKTWKKIFWPGFRWFDPLKNNKKGSRRKLGSQFFLQNDQAHILWIRNIPYGRFCIFWRHDENPPWNIEGVKVHKP